MARALSYWLITLLVFSKRRSQAVMSSAYCVGFPSVLRGGLGVISYDCIFTGAGRECTDRQIRFRHVINKGQLRKKHRLFPGKGRITSAPRAGRSKREQDECGLNWVEAPPATSRHTRRLLRLLPSGPDRVHRVVLREHPRGLH